MHVVELDRVVNYYAQPVCIVNLHVVKSIDK